MKTVAWLICAALVALPALPRIERAVEGYQRAVKHCPADPVEIR